MLTTIEVGESTYVVDTEIRNPRTGQPGYLAQVLIDKQTLVFMAGMSEAMQGTVRRFVEQTHGPLKTVPYYELRNGKRKR